MKGKKLSENDADNKKFYNRMHFFGYEDDELLREEIEDFVDELHDDYEDDDDNDDLIISEDF